MPKQKKNSSPNANKQDVQTLEDLRKESPEAVDAFVKGMEEYLGEVKWFEDTFLNQKPDKKQKARRYGKILLNSVLAIIVITLLLLLGIKSCESKKVCDAQTSLECQYESHCKPLLFGLLSRL